MFLIFPLSALFVEPRRDRKANIYGFIILVVYIPKCEALYLTQMQAQNFT